MRFRSTLLIAIFLGLLALAPGTSAFAAPPPGLRCQDTGNGSICIGAFAATTTYIDDGLSHYCGYGVQGVENDSGHYTVFFNQAGQFLRAVTHEQVRGAFTNLVTGTTLPYAGDFTDMFTVGTPGDPSTITDQETGQVIKVTVPGLGVVMHDVGNITFAPDGSVVVHGPHDAFSGDTQAFCAALA